MPYQRGLRHGDRIVLAPAKEPGLSRHLKLMQNPNSSLTTESAKMPLVQARRMFQRTY